LLPSADGVQVPRLPGRLQSMHGWVQAVSQHTPSTQYPDWHLVPLPQSTPLAYLGAQPPSPLTAKLSMNQPLPVPEMSDWKRNRMYTRA
jgi:hypothetical protein